MMTVNAQCYLTFLHEKVVPCLHEKDALPTVTFIQDGATSHTANPVKEFFIQTFREKRIISKRYKFSWFLRSPDVSPADFWLWEYLNFRVYWSHSSNLSELKDAIRR
ncbi:uncharacterized protein TNCV_4991321 [Trichonephila clavipes]|nr:uncharacterized protein TNCV_4991321 [Trichonephila clavipes]